jgi:hypothetical protein
MTTTSSEDTTTATGTVVWCFIQTKPKALNTVVKRLEQWFASREHATLLSEGYSEKKGQGVLLLELADQDDDYGWLADALEHEKHVVDYSFHEDDGPDEVDNDEEED